MRYYMTQNKFEESVLVFTYKDLNTLIRFNGSQSWKLDSKRVSKCKYIICVNNAKHSLSQNANNHGFAFLVGKISGVARALETKLVGRWIIEFNEYAEVEIPGFWEGLRNPVNYKRTEEINIDLENLVFHKVPERDLNFVSEHIAMENRFFDDLKNAKDEGKNEKSNSNFLEGLSIEEAKIGLSKRYDVSTENIEVILKG